MNNYLLLMKVDCVAASSFLSLRFGEAEIVFDLIHLVHPGSNPEVNIKDMIWPLLKHNFKSHGL